MERREYDVVLVAQAEGGYSVFMPDFSSVATQGETAARAAVTVPSTLIERLARVMEPAYIVVWLCQPVPGLDDDRPIDLIVRGESSRVERLLPALEEAPFT